MWKMLKRHRAKVIVATAVALVLTACLAKRLASPYEGPRYERVDAGTCVLPRYDLFTETLGERVADVLTLQLDGGHKLTCSVDFSAPPQTRLTVQIWLLDSAQAARSKYSDIRASLARVDTWRLDLPVRTAEWTTAVFESEASVLDGNMVITVDMPGDHAGDIDIRFQDPLTAFLHALVDKLRRANDV
jgi:hypothetical protein